ncbi:MFS transporter [Dongia sp.]|uniref:MFS transporter n=1 Tax=Dongia sp. TaxID=1977262 RepID=UPI0035AD7776
MSSGTDGGGDLRRSPRIVVPVLGVTQILAWGSSYYLPAVLAKPIAEATGWSLSWIVGGLSLGLLVAGLASPLVGRRIKSNGGRPILIASAILLAAGQSVLAIAPNLGIFLIGWVVIGLGMGAGLYDPAFSTLGRLYGHGARQLITALTLFGGFASTVCWPLSAFLVSELGWRGACASYAIIQLCISLPLYVFALPKERVGGDIIPANEVESDVSMRTPPRSLFLLLATTIMIASMVSTVISVHLLTLLQAHGLTMAAAVALGALVGPSQVGARFIESLIGQYHHPIWTKLASVSSVLIGLALLWANIPLVFLALIFYGAGIGLESIARATLPLALFGPADYGPIMGRLARPSLIAQAAAPSIGAALIESFGASNALGAIVFVAGANLALAILLYRHIATTRQPLALKAH